MEEESFRQILSHETEIEAELLFDYKFPPPKRVGMLKWRPSDAYLETGWEDEPPQLREQTARTLKFMLAGITAGAVSRTMTAPLDRVKILMQAGEEEGRQDCDDIA
ncbi:hypothetical protein GUITHDRAFT_100175 [Guillardia theta CCMP2712]|uniref:ADP/ATP translocase n=1 Tax=Guillardia theta (strain CCMP2712) TaxID=905079 RepID=L1K0F0_GUITC|nr:hypothetical protein GUITHDRAFT_100175 [Guillardia theta CCMP2712]EKX53925.1 hypothetical protein GUITHDRAFT_100175 [Guillardia theta CCMP2712]|eukprot:XP_005840905.1 hypothetical protein GUITHDRAFT_100175 [Guillardia theta CCMP2712]